MTNKNELRTQVMQARNFLPLAKRQAYNSAITKHLSMLPEWENAEKVFLYLSFGSEFSTQSLIESAWHDHKKVFIPTCLKDRQMAFTLYTPSTPLYDTKFGIKEVLPEAQNFIPASEADFCLVPGLVFDHHGGRIGYGGGFYDRFLPKLSSECFSIAAAFSLQIQDDPLPLESFDYILSQLCNENGVLYLQNKKTSL